MNAVLRTVSISCDARFAAIDRLRFCRVTLSELVIPTTTPEITRPKMNIAITTSTNVKPSSRRIPLDSERSTRGRRRFRMRCAREIAMALSLRSA